MERSNCTLVNKNRPVGRMVKGSKNTHTILCNDCTMDNFGKNTVPIYHINIWPYNQHCHNCGSNIVIGSSSKWPELFEKE